MRGWSRVARRFLRERRARRARTSFVCVILAIAGCAGHRSAESAPPATVERLDPATAIRILEASPRRYVITEGRLRADSVVAPFVGIAGVNIDELDPGASDVWDEAAAELYLGNYERAADLYDALVKAIPRCSACRLQFANALLRLAAARWHDGRNADRLREEAADNLRIAGALDAEVPVGRGIFTPPQWIGRNSIPLWPDDDEAQRILAEGNALYNRGDVENAREQYRRLIRKEPRFCRGYIALGDTYYEEGDLRTATAWYSRALAIDSTDYIAWRSIGHCYEEMGIPAKAKEAAVNAVLYNYHDRESWELLEDIGRALDFTVSPRRLSKRVEAIFLPDSSVRIATDSTLPDEAQFAWLGYAAVRSVWRFEGRFAARHPNTEYRATFEEHMEAIASLAAIWARERMDSTNDVSDEELDRLTEIADEGYLGEYVIYEEMAADDPDVMTWLAKSPQVIGRVREYIERFVLRGVAI